MKSKTTHETRSFNIASFSGISQYSLFSCRIQLHIYMIKSTDFCFFLHSCTFLSMIVFGYCAAAAIYCCYCYYCWCCSRSLLLFVVFMCPLFWQEFDFIVCLWFPIFDIPYAESRTIIAIFTLINGVYVISLFCFYSFWYLFRRRNRFQSPVKQQPCSIKPKIETNSKNRIKPKKKRARVREWEQK